MTREPRYDARLDLDPDPDQARPRLAGAEARPGHTPRSTPASRGRGGAHPVHNTLCIVNGAAAVQELAQEGLTVFRSRARMGSRLEDGMKFERARNGGWMRQDDQVRVSMPGDHSPVYAGPRITLCDLCQSRQSHSTEAHQSAIANRELADELIAMRPSLYCYGGKS